MGADRRSGERHCRVPPGTMRLAPFDLGGRSGSIGLEGSTTAEAVEGGQMSESDGFREMLARQAEAEGAMVYGDPEPRMKLWSRREPVSLVGAWGPNRSG